MVESDIHMKIFNVDIVLANLLLLMKTLLFEVFDHPLQLLDLIRILLHSCSILGNTLSIPVKIQNLNIRSHYICAENDLYVILTWRFGRVRELPWHLSHSTQL